MPGDNLVSTQINAGLRIHTGSSWRRDMLPTQAVFSLRSALCHVNAAAAMSAKRKSYHETWEMDRGMCPTTSHPLLPQLHVRHGHCQFFSNNRHPYRFVYMVASDQTCLFKRAIAAALASHAVLL